MGALIYSINLCDSTETPLDRLLEGSFSQVFAFVDYNRYLGIFGKYLNVLSTFAWNFIDIFIMTVSIALSEKFRQINVRLESAKNKVSTLGETVFNKLRYISAISWVFLDK